MGPEQRFYRLPVTPLGPYVETKIDPNELTIQLFQNGQLRQNSNTR
jgi:2-keto-4-pentenoate hydratase/2-oxohepta-3-ene-1,7-dioic acid hydratase in catechol pathway